MSGRFALCLSFLLAASSVAAQDCGAPVDFLALTLPQGGDPIEVAVEAAYPGLDVD